MQNKLLFLAKRAIESSQRKRWDNSFITVLLLFMLGLFFICEIYLTHDIWNPGVKNINLFDPNYETLGLSTSIYAWQAEGTSSVRIRITDNPDFNIKGKVLSIQRNASPGWSGIGKPILVNTFLEISESVALRLKNAGPSLMFYFEIEEAKTPLNPYPEIWQKEFHLESGEEKTFVAPFSTFYLKPSVQQTGETGNKKYDAADLKQLDILFPPNYPIQIELGAIQVNFAYFSWILAVTLILNLLWWIFLSHYAISNQVSLSNSQFLMEAAKFFVYQCAFILSPNREEIGLALCILIAFSLVESVYQLSFASSGKRQSILTLLSPWIVSSVAMTLSPGWPMIPLLTAAHSFQILRRVKYGLEFSIVFFLLILVIDHYGRGTQIHSISHGVGLFSLFVLYFTTSEQKKFLVIEQEQRDLQILLEQQVQHSQKMEAISQLSRGVAHEFNNLLTGIIGNLRLIQLRKDQDPSDNVHKALESAYRAAETIKKMQLFSQLSKIQTKKIELNPLILETQKLFEQNLSQSIQFHCYLLNTATVIYADPLRLKSVLMNMLINARDAIERDSSGKGRKQHRIALETQILEKSDLPNRFPIGEERFIRIAISDNGIGMDSQTCEHVFDPFFTAKEVGSGLGLGLACAYGIVKEHHGWIDVESQLHEGTAFRIYLPMNRFDSE
jgi:signal transduction histidine kinase